MVCWLALCLGRKVEERLGKKWQEAAVGEEEEEGVKATEATSLQIHTENVC